MHLRDIQDNIEYSDGIREKYLWKIFEIFFENIEYLFYKLIH